jgi:hypothetical protein
MAPQRRISGWALFAMISIVLLGCLVAVVAGVGISIFLRSRNEGSVQLPLVPTATARETRTPGLKTPTPLPSPTSTPRPVLPAPTSTRTQAPRATATPAATQTPALRATAAPTATRDSRPQGTPTPVVCDGIESLGSLTLVSGQSFTCSVSDQELVAEIAKVPDLPCSNVQVAFTDGEIQVSCRMGIRLSAVGEITVQNCQATMQVVRGTPGFTQVVQALLDQYASLAPYDRVCVEEATVGEGVLTVSGYGK